MNKNVDLYKENDRCVTSQIVSLIQKADKYKTLNVFKEDFIKIIEDPTTIISDKKKQEYKTNLNRIKSLYHFRT